MTIKDAEVYTNKAKQCASKPVSKKTAMAIDTPAIWNISDEAREEISTSITQTWTDQAIKCYATRSDCDNCTIPKGNYSFVCQMNKVVPVLLDTLGEPDPGKVQKILTSMFYS
jgi:hypothetical protein